VSAKKVGLGKGFDALIPQNFDKSLVFDDHERIQKIPIRNLSPNPQQPRQYFDDTALAQLATSIKNHGILQPLVVTPGATSDTYIIIAGERRWRASQLAGLAKVPAIIRTAKELERLELAIVENMQRVDLSPLEQAVSIERLHQQFTMKYEAIAERLGRAPSTVNNIVRLLQLPEAARSALHERRITEGHARTILSLKHNPEKQQELLDNILKNDWSVRQAERYVVSIKDGFADKHAAKVRMQTETDSTKKLSQRIGVPVHIRRMAKGGKLEISFKTDSELEDILRSLA
jgi:ParB family transcriptional regulator, chromosome partitioning protein